MTKRDEMAVTAGAIIDKVSPSEPIFILRAQDRAAPKAIREWAHIARGMGAPTEKCDDAMECAIVFEEWQKSNPSKVPD